MTIESMFPPSAANEHLSPESPANVTAMHVKVQSLAERPRNLER